MGRASHESRHQSQSGLALSAFLLDGQQALCRTLETKPPDSPVVVKLTIHDTIQPITADYLQRGLDAAARLHAQAVIVSMGTPGGLLESTRAMVQAIESSPVLSSSTSPRWQ